jgi:integrase
MPHPAIPVDEAPAAFARIWQRRSESTGHAALVAIFLSALRSGEARGLTWSEIGEEVITIPEERTKTGKEHINPLTPRLEAHLRAQPRWSDSDLVFPGRGGKPITDDAPLRALDRCGLGAFTVHGLRACFRTWSGEAGYRRELGEYQLGHLVGSAAERAYARSSLVEGRRPMMQAWEDHLCSLL